MQIPPTASTTAQAARMCREANREIGVILSHGVSDVSPSVLRVEVPRTASETLRVVESLLPKLRTLADKDSIVQRALRATEHNREALAALADHPPARAGAGFHALLSADAACVTPHIG